LIRAAPGRLHIGAGEDAGDVEEQAEGIYQTSRVKKGASKKETD
jgi:hypothetical protein